MSTRRRATCIWAFNYISFYTISIIFTSANEIWQCELRKYLVIDFWIELHLNAPSHTWLLHHLVNGLVALTCENTAALPVYIVAIDRNRHGFAIAIPGRPCSACDCDVGLHGRMSTGDDATALINQRNTPAKGQQTCATPPAPASRSPEAYQARRRKTASELTAQVPVCQGGQGQGQAARHTS